MLALGLGIKVWHIVALVVWIFVCCHYTYDQIAHKGEDFSSAVGWGVAVFIFVPIVVVFFGSVFQWVYDFLQKDVF